MGKGGIEKGDGDENQYDGVELQDNIVCNLFCFYMHMN